MDWAQLGSATTDSVGLVLARFGTAGFVWAQLEWAALASAGFSWAHLGVGSAQVGWFQLD